MGKLWQRLAGFLKREEPATDARAGRVVAVIHCVLNQNVRDTGAATLPDANWALLDLCRTHRVGILQMPCPEMACLGFARERPAGCGLRAMLELEGGRRCCRQLAEQVAEQISDHLLHGHEVLAVLGGNRESPGCAVHGEEGLEPESGVFMLALAESLDYRGIRLPFRPLRDAEPERLVEDLTWVARVFQGSDSLSLSRKES
jgi:predicted secreted protein